MPIMPCFIKSFLFMGWLGVGLAATVQDHLRLLFCISVAQRKFYMQFLFQCGLYLFYTGSWKEKAGVCPEFWWPYVLISTVFTGEMEVKKIGLEGKETQGHNLEGLRDLGIGWEKLWWFVVCCMSSSRSCKTGLSWVRLAEKKHFISWIWRVNDFPFILISHLQQKTENT